MAAHMKEDWESWGGQTGWRVAHCSPVPQRDGEMVLQADNRITSAKFTVGGTPAFNDDETRCWQNLFPFDHNDFRFHGR